MKGIFLLNILLLLCINSFCQNDLSTRLIGHWKATDTAGKTGTLYFVDKINMLFVSQDGKKARGKYSIDTTKDPLWLDMVKEGTQKMEGHLTFIDQNTFRLQLFIDKPRPPNSVAPDPVNTVTFRRVRKKK